MQGSQELLRLGFTPNGDIFEKTGHHQTFVGKVFDDGNPSLCSTLIYMRGVKGNLYVKECVSPGSIKRAVEKFDVPNECLDLEAYKYKWAVIIK